MEQKNLVASLYLRHGAAMKGIDSEEAVEDLNQIARIYNDSGVDKVLLFDLSEDDMEHEMNIQLIKEINRMIEIPVCAGGNINRIEDIKKLLYSGCRQVFLNGSKAVTAKLMEEAAKRFGSEKLAVTLHNVDILFKHRQMMEESLSEIYVLNESVVDAVDNITSLPCIVMVKDREDFVKYLSKETVMGIGSELIDHPGTNIMELKNELARNDISMKRFESSISWDMFKLNSDGMIPVIVQDYQKLNVLMHAYMNREAFEMTIALGKMVYYSRSRDQIWVKGETSGHYQYVKSLTLDCDQDTILAKVSQVGVACHTGAPSCFYKQLMKKDYEEKNPLLVFENLYNLILERKANPKEGSYTNYLLDKGVDKILKKVGEEATEIVIAAKNPETEEIKYEISDFLYHIMVLMVEKGVTWEEITQELANR